MNPAVTTRSPLRYPGGKTRAVKLLTPLITSQLGGKLEGETPPTVLSPFLGGGSVELALTGAGCRVEASDGFLPVAAFWMVLLKNPLGLASSLREGAFPASKELFVASRGRLRDVLDSKVDVLDLSDEQLVSVATDFFVVNRSSFSGATLSGGYSEQAAAKRYTESSIGRVEHFSNRLLSVGCSDFVEVFSPPSLSRSDFVFCDPPYLLPDSGNSLYGSNGDMHKNFPHEELRRVLGECGEVPWLVTYNDTERIRVLYEGFRVVSAEWSYGMNRTKKSSEVVITNF